AGNRTGGDGGSDAGSDAGGDSNGPGQSDNDGGTGPQQPNRETGADAGVPPEAEDAGWNPRDARQEASDGGWVGSSKLNKQDAEKLLDAIKQDERNLQLWRFQQQKRTRRQNEKDW
ncbi:MAG TPA: aerotolerance regulator BatC, partial [Myxococcales bacterium]